MKNKSICLAGTLAILVSSLGMVAPVFATDAFCTGHTKNEVGEELWAAMGCATGTSDQLGSSVVNILKTIIGALGIVAAIFIIIGGITYMTSAGDASKVKKAKDTILYASIGLIICALAFAIVNWVIGILN